MTMIILILSFIISKDICSRNVHDVDLTSKIDQNQTYANQDIRWLNVYKLDVGFRMIVYFYVNFNTVEGKYLNTSIR